MIDVKRLANELLILHELRNKEDTWLYHSIGVVGTAIVICSTLLIGYVIHLHYDHSYRKKQSSLEQSRSTREKNKHLREDAEKLHAKRIEFVHYVKDIMKSSLLNDDAKVGLVLNALLGMYTDDSELKEAAKAWKQALSKNKRKSENVIKTVTSYESQEVS